jgi:aldose 1-epimerase
MSNHMALILYIEGSDSLYDHLVRLNSDFYTPSQANGVPTGEVAPVGRTPFDLRATVRLGDAARRVVVDTANQSRFGFDHNFVVARKGRIIIGLISRRK